MQGNAQFLVSSYMSAHYIIKYCYAKYSSKYITSKYITMHFLNSHFQVLSKNHKVLLHVTEQHKPGLTCTLHGHLTDPTDSLSVL